MRGKDYIGIALLIIAVLFIPHIVNNDYYLGVLIFAGFNCLACIGLCLLMGYAGQISIGHGAFVAIGAYSSAILTTTMGWSPWASMGCGIIIAILIAFLVGIPTLRLKGHYLAMATLGIAAIIHIVAVAAVGLTGGPAGIVNIPRISLFGYALNSDTRYFYFCWGFVVLGIFLAFNLINSRVGRGLRAIHGSEDAAASLGVNITVYKVKIFILGAVYAAVSGSLYAYYVNYLDPSPFGVMYSILLLIMVAVGGLHQIWGAVIGSVLLTLLPEILSFADDYFRVIGIHYKPDYDTLVYGLILLMIMLFLPEGLFVGIGNSLKSIWGIKEKISRRPTESVK